VQNEDGSLDFDFHVDTDEASYLMNFAITNLINLGALSIEASTEETQVDLFADIQGGIQ
jgi:hypothetical protein